MISPNTVYRLPAERLPINQATGKVFVIRVVLNYFTLQNTGKYLIEGQVIYLCFLIGVVSDAYSITMYRADDVVNIHFRFCSVIPVDSRRLHSHHGIGIAGSEGVHVGQNHPFGAVAAKLGFVFPANDGKGVQHVAGVLTGEAVEVVEGVEAGARVAARFSSYTSAVSE